MSAEQLCEPCQNLFRQGIDTQSTSEHHPDTASLQNALQLPCCLCVLAWSNPPKQPELLPSKTTCSFLGNNANAIKLTFKRSDNALRPNKGQRRIALVPWQGRLECVLLLRKKLIMLAMANHSYPGLLSTNTGAVSSMAFLLSKYNECCKQHTLCRLPQSDAQFYPTRLIDVGVQEDVSIRLCEMYSPGERGPYFCLSHCWGKKMPLRLTKDTLSTLQAGIPIEHLPKTFREAVSVTRSFEVRYLWYVNHSNPLKSTAINWYAKGTAHP
jgi:hypothetical protein